MIKEIFLRTDLNIENNTIYISIEDQWLYMTEANVLRLHGI